MSDDVQANVGPLTRLRAANQVDLLCDAFEEAWARGEGPQIEDYLHRCNASEQAALLVELLLVDREFRIKRGEVASRDSYLRRFPDYARVIEGLEFATISDDRQESPSRRDRRVIVPGGRIAHFELLEVVGSGASGTVWRARDTRLMRIVAVKIPRRCGLSGSERARFLREGRAAAQLRHPNIVTVFEVGEDHQQAFIVAEFVDGTDLRSWLAQRQPSFREAAELAAQLAEALHHAHEQGVIHRDLKPANILMDNTSRPKITDFGLAKLTADTACITLEGNILGTPAYMAPEQARGDIGRIDRRSDVYSLGALLYEMLTGKAPFEGDMAGIVHRVIHVEPRCPRTIEPTLPRDLETICLKAIKKDSAGRYPSAQDMAVDLRRFVRGEPILARPTSMAERIWRSIRRHPGIAAAIILPLIILAAASAKIKLMSDENYRQQGYRQVTITTIPPGARIAIVPIDKRTGEPDANPAAVIRPSGKTPLSVPIKPDEYFFEAVLFHEGDAFDIAEVYETILPPELMQKRATSSSQGGHDPDAKEVEITIFRADKVTAGMTAVPISEGLRRKNRLLPPLLYVDAADTTPSELEIPAINFEIAMTAARQMGKRLPSADEYDAILNAVTNLKMDDRDSDPQTKVAGLTSGLLKWTTTKYDFPGVTASYDISADLRNLRLLKGDSEMTQIPGIIRSVEGYWLAPRGLSSAMIGIRAVRSGAPRFVRP